MLELQDLSEAIIPLKFCISSASIDGSLLCSNCHHDLCLLLRGFAYLFLSQPRIASVDPLQVDHPSPLRHDSLYGTVNRRVVSQVDYPSPLRIDSVEFDVVVTLNVSFIEVANQMIEQPSLFPNHHYNPGFLYRLHFLLSRRLPMESRNPL